MRDPKILIWDLETGYAESAIFSFFNDRIPHDNLLKEWYIICGAYKWLGDTKTKAVSVLDYNNKDTTDDYYVVKHLYEILSQADAIVHHYGDNFDIKKFNTRLIYHGFDPLPNIIQIDTYKIAKSKFKFMSNRLDYIGKYLGVGGKIHTTPGLWMRCLRGVKSAIREMVAYNKQDVNLLEAVYLKLAPFVPSKLNFNHFYGEFEKVCPTCGDTNLQKRGFRLTRIAKWQRFQCQGCGAWSSAPIKENETLGKIR